MEEFSKIFKIIISMKKIATPVLILSFVVMSVPRFVSAHCPLCTLGAGAVAVGASLLGVKSAVIGVFLGAFGLALGLWFARIIKKNFIPYQEWVLGIGSFLATILPLRSLMQDYGSVYVSLSGDYGSLLNRTYIWDKFLVGSIIGGLFLAIAPWISVMLTKNRKGIMLPFQGMGITFLLLIMAAFALQFLL